MTTRQASKTTQSAPLSQQEPQHQKGPHPSVILQEVHSMAREQQETMRVYATILEHITNELADLKSRVQTVQSQIQTLQAQAHAQIMYEDDEESDEELVEDEGAEYEDDEELEEQGDEGNEDVANVADQEDGNSAASWMEKIPEEEPTPQRRASQPADLTGPQPLLLPYSSKAALRKHKGVQV